MPRPTADTAPTRPGRRRLRTTVITCALGVVMFTAGAVGLTVEDSSSDAPAAHSRAGAAAAGPTEALRAHVRRLPKDPVGWAGLGMAYVQQARSTADPATYTRAETALKKSLKLQPADNFQAESAMSALAAARHDFPLALTWAERATRTNPASPEAHGVLADAYTQLGRYDASYAAVQRMTDLRPDAASLARASYTWELRGDTRRAGELMRRSLESAASVPDRSFARTHLALLAVESGDPRTGLKVAEAGLKAAPRDPALLDARARAHTALGNTRQAVADYTAAIAVAPLPHLLLGLGELHQAQGREQQAEEQYALLRAQETLRRQSGDAPDVDAILFEADHGDPAQAVAMGKQALRTRPFIAVQDAYAWALHRAGRDAQALEQADRALALGTRSALFHYHRAMIHQALGTPESARRDLARATDIDPDFHPLHAPDARAALQRIDNAR